MNALDVVNDCKSLLETLGQPVYIADTLQTDESGLLTTPSDAAQFIIFLITGTPEHEWGTTRYATVRLQVNALSVTEGHALAMLQAAAAVLSGAKYVPGFLTNISRSGPYTGYAQLFDRNTSP